MKKLKGEAKQRKKERGRERERARGSECGQRAEVIAAGTPRCVATIY